MKTRRLIDFDKDVDIRAMHGAHWHGAHCRAITGYWD